MYIAHSGFPLDSRLVPSIGVYNALALFVDYSDQPSTESPQAALDRAWTETTEQYLEDLSHGRLDIQVVPLPRWLRADQPFEDYSLGAGGTDESSFFREVIAKADPWVDFADVDAVWIFNERTAMDGGGQAWFDSQGVPVDDGRRSIRNGLHMRVNIAHTAPDFARGLAHEALHTFGLPDLYDWERDRQLPVEESWRFVGNFDPMGNTGGFAGGTVQGAFSPFNGNELLAWHRWQLGWIDDTQVVCAPVGSAIARLSALASTDGDKAVVKPTGPRTALVVEARLGVGYDSDLEAEGVLVYTVDAAVPAGDGPIVVQGLYDGDWPNGSSLLQVGERLVVGRTAIRVLSRNDLGFEVEVYELLCHGRPVTIDMRIPGTTGVGTAGDDVILGTRGDDTIRALGGNDVVCGGPGSDRIDAGVGDDLIYGGGSHDVIEGGEGSDTIYGQPGGDVLRGGAGDDVLLGGPGFDTLYGQDGNDNIQGAGGDDTLWGGPGNDKIYGKPGDDVMHGQAGNDEMYAASGDDEIYGGPGRDRIQGAAGEDHIDGGAGNDVLYGQAGNDFMTGRDGDDTLYAGPGDDDVRGGNGSDELQGATGNDLLYGQADADVLYGQDGADLIDGGGAVDVCWTGPGDTIANC